jgi:NAD(P)-dependent dehydrogenase (short-subunit alcohol dehydrogenase family)
VQTVFDLTGRVAVVTGSTKGIGRAMAEGLARAGASVVVSSRKQELCDEVAAEIAKATGRDTLGLACHVGEWDRVAQFVDTVTERFGGIDVLVNNAGINPARVKVADMTLDYWRKVFSVNLEGPLRMAQLVAPVMRDRGGGSIINIGTMAAYSGGSTVCAYGASKAALLNLTKSMAQEWAPWKVRVNLLSPGPFMSEMMEGGAKTMPGYFDLVAGGTFQKRIADPHEIVGPVLYLASDASSFVTGDDLSVSGGMHK